MFYQSCFQNRLALTTLTKKTSVSGKQALREQNVLPEEDHIKGYVCIFNLNNLTEKYL